MMKLSKTKIVATIGPSSWDENVLNDFKWNERCKLLLRLQTLMSLKEFLKVLKE